MENLAWPSLPETISQQRRKIEFMEVKRKVAEGSLIACALVALSSAE